MFSGTVRETVTAVALRRDFEPAELLAVAHVESSGVAFWTVNGQQVPAIRIEGHYFYRLLQGAERDRAVKEGLAHSNAGVVKNPKSWAGRYAMLERMKAINEQAALASCSWGIGQVMGDNWQALGFNSVHGLVRMAMSGVEGQLDLMIRFIDTNNLRRFIRARKWAAFARRYNGKNYKKNRYDAKLEAAYARFSKPSVFEPDPFIKHVQQGLAKLGFNPGAADGRDGPKTKAAIKAFQAANGLVPDGIAGPLTVEEMENDLAALRAKTADKAAKIGAGTTVASGTGAGAAEKATDALQQASDSLEPLAQISNVIMWVFITLALVGVALALWGIFRKGDD